MAVAARHAGSGPRRNTDWERRDRDTAAFAASRGRSLGFSYAQMAANWNYATIGGSGPNAGFSYVTSVSYPAATFYYQYEIANDLENASSAFAIKQCGTGPAPGGDGFISYANLLAQTNRHKASQVAQSRG